MTRFFAFFLCTLLLFQTFSRELLVPDYQARKAEITQLFCVNKDKPRMQCNGKCHLRKQLRKASDAESKAPGGLAKVKYEVLPPAARFAPRPQPGRFAVPLRFAPALAVRYAFSPEHGIFHPPAA